MLFYIGFHLLLIARVSCDTLQRIPSFGDGPSKMEGYTTGSVQLPCSIYNLGSNRVIWTKYGTPQALTAGAQILDASNRQRMSVEMRQVHDKTFYNLTISELTQQDNGFYLCKIISDDGHRRTKSVKLEIEGIGLTGSRFVDQNQRIHLKCQKPVGVDGPMTWFKDGRILGQSARVAIHQWDTHSLKGPGSMLTISQAEMSDSGTYECRGQTDDGADVHHIMVHVLNTEDASLREPLIRF